VTAILSASAAAVTVGSAGGIDLFGLRDEFISWSRRTTKKLSARLTGLRRFDRSQRLAAAHAVIVVTAFYEALGDVLREDPQLGLRSLRMSRAEQVAIWAGRWPSRDSADLVTALLETPIPIPTPLQPFESTLAVLEDHYRMVAAAARRFLLGLSAAESHGDQTSPVLDQITERVPQLAVQRYEEEYRSLAAQVPEFAIWAGLVDAQATRTALRESFSDVRTQLTEVRVGLRDIGTLLATRCGDGTVDEIRTGLAKLHRAQLDRPVLASANAPMHVVLPSLGSIYVNPRARVAVAGPSDHPATEAWWLDKPCFDDLQTVLIGHLTSTAATAGPLVVLGHPGSGKSVLTKILAAQLPESDFLVARVELRNVPADTSVQAQIEEALYQMLGERITWPDLGRRSGNALPIIMMDGFDELLQATGMNRADYLEEIQEFQRREAELGRPLAVLVTSRTVVADRARFPEGSVVVRLEPFDEAQVRTWLAVWNDANHHNLRDRSLHPLPAEIALIHEELARQPLLLLLLALYDASENALQNTRSVKDQGVMERVELYERLFGDFISREVGRHASSYSVEQRDQAVEAEWRRLSAVGLAMLNHGGDVITETELDNDVPGLLGPRDLLATDDTGVSRALTAGQILVGRFFFIHQSRATRDTGLPENSFEFLHSTFGDFLAARWIVDSLVDLAAERVHQRRRPQPTLDAGFLYAALSFATITRRAPLRDFCRGMLTRLSPQARRDCHDLVLELLPEAGFPHPTWSRSGYEPRLQPLAACHAAFSANLVCLAVMLATGPVDVATLVGEPVGPNWRRQSLLWHSQLLPEDRRRMWQNFRVTWHREGSISRLEIRQEDGSEVSTRDSLPWPPDPPSISTECQGELLSPDVVIPSDSKIGEAIRRSAFMQTTIDVREYLYVLMPYWRTIGDMEWWAADDDHLVLDAHVLTQLLLDPTSPESASRRVQLYTVALTRVGTHRYRHLVLRQLIEDLPHLPIDMLPEIIALLQESDVTMEPFALTTALATLAAATTGDTTSDSEQALQVRDLCDRLAQKLTRSTDRARFGHLLSCAGTRFGLRRLGLSPVLDAHGRLASEDTGESEKPDGRIPAICPLQREITLPATNHERREVRVEAP